MIARTDLIAIANAKLEDAEILYQHNRCAGAVYMSGYAIELILKARLCKNLNWSGFPDTNSEFQNYKSFRTHDLDVLLSLSGIEAKIKDDFFYDWSNVSKWHPEMRYMEVDSITLKDTKMMIDSIKKLIPILK